MKQQLLAAFRQHNIPKVFELLNSVHLDEQASNSVEMLNARWQKANRSFAEGGITFDQKSVEEANINMGLLKIINNLPEKTQKKASSSTAPRISIVFAIAAIFVAVFLYYNKNQPTNKKTISTFGDESPLIIGDSATIIFNNQRKPENKGNEK